MKIAEEIRKLKQAIKGLKTSDNYDSSHRAYSGNAGDSSDLAELRAGYIKQAEQEFISQHKIKILALAIELAEKDLEECRKEVKS